jgi:hypothetical protein
MTRRKHWLILIPFAIPGWYLMRTTAAPLQSADSSNTTLFIRLGDHAASVEKWDGTIRIAGGELVSLVEWQFSAEDGITGRDSWRVSTRRDAVAPYADLHYTEMRPGSTPEVRFHPIGLYATMRAGGGDTRIEIHTAQGDFGFRLAEIATEPKAMLGGRATVARAPSVAKLTTAEYEDDNPAIAALSDGSIAVAWIAYKGRADRILLRQYRSGAWGAVEEVAAPAPGIFRCSLAAGREGNLWAFWSQREGDAWHLWVRRRAASGWNRPERVGGTGTDTFHSAAASPDGTVFVAWQSFRGGRSHVYLRSHNNGGWTPEMKLSESAGNDWEPAVAAGAGNSAYIAWDTYDQGNYDIRFRALRAGSLQPEQRVTSGPRFQAHAAVAVDAQGRPWVAWDEAGVNWGKDQGFLIPTPLATPLHRERNIALAMFDGSAWQSPRTPAPMEPNAEHPRIAFDGEGNLSMIFRHWTRREDRTIGSPINWENFLTRFDGREWSEPLPIPRSQGSIEKHAALTSAPDGKVWAAWMTDNRPFSSQVPGNADIFAAPLPKAHQANWAAALAPYNEPKVEAIPVHTREADDIKAVRAYEISAASRRYHIYRGDMHRHSDFSQDFKYDGSLLEIYRYAIDAAAMDYLAITDHQAGFDQEYTWWEGQKLVDLFQTPPAFSPLYAYERSVPYPNGHRNVIFKERGVRTLPIPPDEMQGKAGAAKLYEYLRANGGIAMPHSSATGQGTDWRDNGGDLEPLVEIYQGYRTSYEYEGAPRAATANNPQAQKSGWEPAGFVWNAWAKGYKLGVQASSDHWSTHISYACLVAENLTRESLFDAIKKRRSYGATDNIVLEFRSGDHLMGEAFTSAAAPRFTVRTIGTGTIKQVDVIKNRQFIYTTRPGERQASFELTDLEFGPGESWYYVRVLQEDGQLAWSSPIWIKKQ